MLLHDAWVLGPVWNQGHCYNNNTHAWKPDLLKSFKHVIPHTIAQCEAWEKLHIFTRSSKVRAPYSHPYMHNVLPHGAAARAWVCVGVMRITPRLRWRTRHVRNVRLQRRRRRQGRIITRRHHRSRLALCDANICSSCVSAWSSCRSEWGAEEYVCVFVFLFHLLRWHIEWWTWPGASNDVLKCWDGIECT